MTDKELLELAAKAAGLKGLHERAGEFCYTSSGGHGGSVMWNPLTDDGDALRLAVKLDIDVMPKWGDDCICITRGGDAFDEPRLPDMCASMRRAIVRAAAAIGEKL